MPLHSTMPTIQKSFSAKCCSYQSGLSQRSRRRPSDKKEAYLHHQSRYYLPSLPFSYTTQTSRLWLDKSMDHGARLRRGRSKCHNKPSDCLLPRLSTEVSMTLRDLR